MKPSNTIVDQSLHHQFKAKGFFTIENILSAHELRWTNDVINQFINEQLDASSPGTGTAIIERNGNRFVAGINRIYHNLGVLPLYLLGVPAIIDAAKVACNSDDVICTHEWIVVKNAGDEHEVKWHQDFIHDGVHSAINVGIYFNDAEEDAVRFIPGARSCSEDISAINRRYRPDDPELEMVRVRAGGIAVHDVLAVHGSPPLKAKKYRKTLYFEFRPSEMLEGHPTFPLQYIQLRQQLSESARAVYERLKEHPTGDLFALRKDMDMELLARLDEIYVRPEPANYG